MQINNSKILLVFVVSVIVTVTHGYEDQSSGVSRKSEETTEGPVWSNRTRREDNFEPDHVGDLGSSGSSEEQELPLVDNASEDKEESIEDQSEEGIVNPTLKREVPPCSDQTASKMKSFSKFPAKSFLNSASLERLEKYSCSAEASIFGHDHPSGIMVHEFLCEIRKLFHYLLISAKTIKSQLHLEPLDEDDFDAEEGSKDEITSLSDIVSSGTLMNLLEHGPIYANTFLKDPENLVVIPDFIKDCVPLYQIQATIKRMKTSGQRFLDHIRGVFLHLVPLHAQSSNHFGIVESLQQTVYSIEGKLSNLAGYKLDRSDDCDESSSNDQLTVNLLELFGSRASFYQFVRFLKEFLDTIHGAYQGYHASGIPQSMTSGAQTFSSATKTSVASGLSQLPLISYLLPNDGSIFGTASSTSSSAASASSASSSFISAQPQPSLPHDNVPSISSPSLHSNYPLEPNSNFPNSVNVEDVSSDVMADNLSDTNDLSTSSVEEDSEEGDSSGLFVKPESNSVMRGNIQSSSAAASSSSSSTSTSSLLVKEILPSIPENSQLTGDNPFLTSDEISPSITNSQSGSSQSSSFSSTSSSIPLTINAVLPNDLTNPEPEVKAPILVPSVPLPSATESQISSSQTSTSSSTSTTTLLTSVPKGNVPSSPRLFPSPIPVGTSSASYSSGSSASSSTSSFLGRGGSQNVLVNPNSNNNIRPLPPVSSLPIRTNSGSYSSGSTSSASSTSSILGRGGSQNVLINPNSNNNIRRLPPVSSLPIRTNSGSYSSGSSSSASSTSSFLGRGGPQNVPINPNSNNHIRPFPSISPFPVRTTSASYSSGSSSPTASTSPFFGRGSSQNILRNPSSNNNFLPSPIRPNSPSYSSGSSSSSIASSSSLFGQGSTQNVLRNPNSNINFRLLSPVPSLPIRTTSPSYSSGSSSSSSSLTGRGSQNIYINPNSNNNIRPSTSVSSLPVKTISSSYSSGSSASSSSLGRGSSQNVLINRNPNNHIRPLPPVSAPVATNAQSSSSSSSSSASTITSATVHSSLRPSANLPPKTVILNSNPQLPTSFPKPTLNTLSPSSPNSFNSDNNAALTDDVISVPSTPSSPITISPKVPSINTIGNTNLPTQKLPSNAGLANPVIPKTPIVLQEISETSSTASASSSSVISETIAGQVLPKKNLPLELPQIRSTLPPSFTRIHDLCEQTATSSFSTNGLNSPLKISVEFPRNQVVSALGNDVLSPGDIIAVSMRNGNTLFGSVLDAVSPIAFNICSPWNSSTNVRRSGKVWQLRSNDFRDPDCERKLDSLLNSYGGS